MDGRKGKSRADIVGTVGSLLLFFVFTVCMLVIIAAAASTYSSIKTGFGQTFTSSASLRYMSNKIRSADSCELMEDGKGIVLESGGIACVIYYDNGGLYEKNVTAEGDLSANGGYRIFDISGLSITERDGLYEISVSLGGDSSSVFIGSR